MLTIRQRNSFWNWSVGMIPVFHVILKGHVQSLPRKYKNNLWWIQDFPFWAKNQLFGKKFEKIA